MTTQLQPSLSSIPAASLTPRLSEELYEQMYLIRIFEEQSLDLFKKSLVRGTVHPSIGQEAIAVGVTAALRKSDFVMSTYRGHGHCIAKGADLSRMMGELLGKQKGYCKGKGGSMHICDPAIGFLGANGIVGAGMPIAGGVALKLRLDHRDDVVVCFFGDGASNQGVFHETANMAAIWKLPLIFVCENNGYGLSTPTFRACSVVDLALRATGHGFPGVTVDGNDLPAVYDAAISAVARARAGEGPTFIECKTHRWERHSALARLCHADESDANAWSRHDPIVRFEKWLIDNGVLDSPKAEAIKRRAQQRVQDAIETAMRWDESLVEEAHTDVYASSK